MPMDDLREVPPPCASCGALALMHCCEQCGVAGWEYPCAHAPSRHAFTNNGQFSLCVRHREAAAAARWRRFIDACEASGMSIRAGGWVTVPGRPGLIHGWRKVASRIGTSIARLAGAPPIEQRMRR
jgi:hypothetical protein